MVNPGEDSASPQTVSQALWQLADWLDEADRLINKLAEAKGIERRNDGDDVQRDIRRLSRWFHGQPECAKAAWDYVQHFGDRDADARQLVTNSLREQTFLAG